MFYKYVAPLALEKLEGFFASPRCPQPRWNCYDRALQFVAARESLAVDDWRCDLHGFGVEPATARSLDN